jgi:hypothetical protein
MSSMGMLKSAPHRHDTWANIPERSKRKKTLTFNPYFTRILAKRFFNRIREYRRVATRYGKLAGSAITIQMSKS